MHRHCLDNLSALQSKRYFFQSHVVESTEDEALVELESAMAPYVETANQSAFLSGAEEVCPELIPHCKVTHAMSDLAGQIADYNQPGSYYAQFSNVTQPDNTGFTSQPSGHYVNY